MSDSAGEAVADLAARQQALDPETSFVVQAPAGSGKTSLLTQRILTLLTRVSAPEQIVAITFTRKAAEEMRSRIMQALTATDSAPPLAPHAAHTYELACAVRRSDEAQGWQLLKNPARLRIMTIDALAQHLVRQMPVTAGNASTHTIEEDAGDLYQQAARATLDLIAGQTDYAMPVRAMLQYLENDWRKLEQLLGSMLATRDQWLNMLAGGADSEFLSACLRTHAALVVDQLITLLPAHLADEWLVLAHYAGGHLDDSLLGGIESLPPSEAVAHWQALVAMLLTRNGSWRKQVTVKDGFPPGGGAAKAMKQRWAGLMATLKEEQPLLNAAAHVQRLPHIEFDSNTRDAVNALIALLKLAVAQLNLISEQDGRTDFTSYSLAALKALGEADNPTDLALSLDYQIQHLLVDEFQDTSHTQFELISRLTAGWQLNDGRTLFLVGDPMQSIYRFRQADVQLFQQVRRSGAIGEVKLTTLTLNTNFRSQQGLVTWINKAIATTLEQHNLESDFFKPQDGVKPAEATTVELIAATSHDVRSEAAEVVSRISALRAAKPQDSVAVLVRSRAHIGDIVGALQEAGINVVARELRLLTSAPVTRDLLALARAMLHDADRVAWLALLRAPWCGLSLVAMQRLAAHDSTVAQAIADPACRRLLDNDDQQRLERVATVIQSCRECALKQPFAQILEQAWIALGGPAVYASADAERDAMVFFSLLNSLERSAETLTAGRLEKYLAGRYASGRQTAAANAVEVMTIHRAKGLEFDHVIIPGAGRSPRPASKALLMWRNETLENNQRLLLAPLPAPGSDASLYDYLRYLDSCDVAAESVRLLYVALTRARRSVVLLGHAECNKDQQFAARKGSFLALLWSQFESKFSDLEHAETASADALPLPQLSRARIDSLPAFVAAQAPSPGSEQVVEFEWAGLVAKHLGTVVHRLLQALDWQVFAGDTEVWLKRALGFARAQLIALGVSDNDLVDALKTVEIALEKTLQSERAKWLFADSHTDQHAEWALATRSEGIARRLYVDRSFVDASNTRWIVDFKTGYHSGGALDAYLDSEVSRYAPQLERYARAIGGLESRPVQLALYFPMHDAWREWPYGNTPQNH